ncbi:MAG: nucleotidyltransferase family protein [Eubacteriaceae bacterium]|nr:nucleotidyltransferase family protein [Eubacteriaceae bacterium]
MEKAYIPAEFDPFHLGHEYLIKRVKEHDIDAVICGMSGPFAQRGEPAFFDKFARARAAVRGGADVVFQTPHIFALSPARSFAEGHIRLCEASGCRILAFGVQGNIADKLLRSADLMKVDRVNNIISTKLKDNTPYPAARIEALEETDGGDYSFLRKPNNILALEYLMALERLGCSAEPFMIERLAAASASAIRSKASEGKNISSLLPESSREEAGFSDTEDDRKRFDILFKAMLISVGADGLKKVKELPEGTENRMISALSELDISMEAFTAKVTSKSLTKSRARRILINAFLGIDKDMEEYFDKNPPVYFRLLAMSEAGRKAVGEITDKGQAAVIANVADSLPHLNETSLRSILLDIKAQNFRDIFSGKYNDDYRQPPRVIPDTRNRCGFS